MKKGFSLSMRLLAIFLLALTIPAMAQKKAKEPKVIEDGIFLIKLTEEATKKATKAIDDELSFKGGKAKSKALSDKYKFKAGSFTATADSTDPEDPIVTFEAEMKGDTDDDVLIWKGTITGGEDIEGTATWNKKGKVKKEYSFSGALRKKK